MTDQDKAKALESRIREIIMRDGASLNSKVTITEAQLDAAVHEIARTVAIVDSEADRHCSIEYQRSILVRVASAIGYDGDYYELPQAVSNYAAQKATDTDWERLAKEWRAKAESAMALVGADATAASIIAASSAAYSSLAESLCNERNWRQQAENRAGALYAERKKK